MVLLSLYDYINELTTNDNKNRSLLLDKITSYNDFLQTQIHDIIEKKYLSEESVNFIKTTEIDTKRKMLYLVGTELEFTDLGIDYIGRVRPYYSNIRQKKTIEKLITELYNIKRLTLFERIFKFNKIIKNKNYGT